MLGPRRISALAVFDNVATGGYIRIMRAVGIKMLKNKLSAYIRLASEGETVLVTDRDRIVAEINPPHPGRSEVLADAVLADAVRSGWITPPVLRHPLIPRQPVGSLSEILEELHRTRDER